MSIEEFCINCIPNGLGSSNDWKQLGLTLKQRDKVDYMSYKCNEPSIEIQNFLNTMLGNKYRYIVKLIEKDDLGYPKLYYVKRVGG